MYCASKYGSRSSVHEEKSGLPQGFWGLEVLLKRTVEGSPADVAQVCTLSTRASEAYIKEGRGDRADSAIAQTHVRTVFVAPPPGLPFCTPVSSCSLEADYFHFFSLSRTIFFKADKVPCGTDHMNPSLRSSERDRKGAPLEVATIMKELDTA